MEQIYLIEHRISPSDENSLKIIGVFSSRSVVRDVIQHYKKSVNGFRDFPDGFRVFAYNIANDKKKKSFSKIFLVVSWMQKQDEEFDIRYEGLFFTKGQALQFQIRKALLHPFRKSIIESFRIDRAEWEDGFVML